jgi:hypothetical protein
MAELVALQDTAYDEGYLDAIEGKQPRDAGDLQTDYNAGYDDGMEDRGHPLTWDVDGAEEYDDEEFYLDEDA